MQRLNIGCADVQPTTWTNVDRDVCGQEIVADLLDGLPFESDYFDYIVANHTIQMIRFDDLSRAFAELRRVLKPGGVLRILVPDAYRAIYGWIDGSVAYPVAPEIEPTPDGRFLRYLFWHGDARSAFTADSLIDALERSGFVEAATCFYGQTELGPADIVELDSREAESLIVEVRK